MENQLFPFEGEKIRKTWHNDEWYFVIEDIILSITASSNPKGYIRDMRRRDPILSQGWGQIAHTLAGEFVTKAESKGYKVISNANYLEAKNDENELPSSE